MKDAPFRTHYGARVLPGGEAYDVRLDSPVLEIIRLAIRADQ